eukprot:gene6078-10086_t
MEANKDAAEQYYDLAMEKIQSKEYPKALQYLLKSYSLYPMDKTGEKIKKIKKFLSNPQNSKPKQQETPEQIKIKEELKQKEEESKFPKEQIEEIKLIIKTKDYYKVLSVEKNATEEQITKSYRKLCMKFHPDVNKAPGATEAFKTIGSAYSCLKDKQKRSNYDRFGSEDGPMRQTTSRPFYTQRGGYYQQAGDEDFDELFRAFFGGSTGGMYRQQSPFFTRRQRRQRQREEQEQQEEEQEQNQTGNCFSFLLQFLPIFIIFILPSLVNFIDNINQRSPFSLEKTNTHSVHRITKFAEVDYYVQPTFYNQFARHSGLLANVENKVLYQHFQTLKDNCNIEKQKKLEAMKSAQQFFGDERTEKVELVEKIKLETCIKLKEFKKFMKSSN